MLNTRFRQTENEPSFNRLQYETATQAGGGNIPTVTETGSAAIFRLHPAAVTARTSLPTGRRDLTGPGLPTPTRPNEDSSSVVVAQQP